MMELDLEKPATLRWYNIPSDDRIDRGFTMAFHRLDEAIHFYHDKLTKGQRAMASITTDNRYLTHQDIDAVEL
ncbi:hypothetical protein [Aestuariispira ectoiniformans]|uniref:hypothetical protein n=1 Tax=Aestuariispira ectoiniformans TaxID=2775080 RepID=UPI00223C0FBD|nr:hypothetical protein [Aestuariispira ectoiniformans]